MPGYVDLSSPNPLDDIGARMRQMDAYSTAGNALSDGDYAGARNSLMSFGYPDAASKVQTMQDQSDANDRANDAEGRTNADRALAAKVGSQYASGDTQGAKAAALSGGNIDLANQLGTYEGNNAQRAQQAAVRAAMATAAKQTEAGDIQGARKTLMPFYPSVPDFMGDLQKSQKDVGTAAGNLALAFEGAPEGWQNTGVPALRKMGINPEGFEDEAGRQALLAKAGLSPTVYKADQAAQNAQNKTSAGNSDTKRAQALLASYQTDNPDVTVPSDAYQKLIADKNYMLSTTQDAQGNKVATAVLVDGRTKTAVDAAERVVKENQDANAKDGGNRPTDFRTVYRDVAGRDAQQTNADARMRMTDPSLRGEIALKQNLAKADVGSNVRQTSAVQAMNHMSTADAVLDMPGMDDALAPIQKVGGYQTWANLADSGRVQVPALLGMLRASVAISAREVANAAHIPGSGPESDARGQEMRQSLENIVMDSPNVAVAKMRMNNMRALAAGFAKAPLPSEIHDNKGFQDARRQDAAKAVSTIMQPEVNGQIPPAPPQPGQPQQPGAPIIRRFNPVTGKIE